MATRTLRVLVVVLLAGSAAFAGDVRGAAEPVAAPVPQTVELQASEPLVEVEPASVLFDDTSRNDCAVMLVLYFTGDPSMAGVSLFQILATCD